MGSLKKESKLNQILLLIASVEKEPGISKQKLCQRFGLSESELDDILDMVWCCGLPGYTPYDLIEVIREGDRVWIRSADYFKRPVRLTLSEAFAIVLGADLLFPLRFKENTSLRRAAEKVKAIISQESHLKLEELSQRIRLRLQPEWYRDVLEKVKTAIEERVSVEIDYYTRGRGEGTKRKVNPYFLSWSGGQHYLIGFCHLRKGERIFRLENIRELRLTKESFAVPASFNPEKYARGAVYIEAPQDIEVKLLFQPSVATWVAEQWSREQLTQSKDGSLVLTLRSSNLAWLAKELLEYGDQVKVLEPPELKEALLEKVRLLREKYEGQQAVGRRQGKVASGLVPDVDGSSSK